MSEKQTDFWTLSEAVIAELKGMEYTDSTLASYSWVYARLGSFMKDRSIKAYSSAVGEAFIAEYYPCNTRRRRRVLTIIKRLDDYQEYCISIGNRFKTVDKKKYFCLMFLHFLTDIDCNDISNITAEIVAKSCLIYANKEGYAFLRQFLRYLFENGLITKDYSAVVPHFKRRQVVPSVFTPEEIKKIEETITPDTPIGKRNFAILLLVTRMGLRSGDIVELKLSTIDFLSRHIDLVQQKTGEPLSVFIPDDVCFALKEHIESAGSRLSDGYVFHSMKAPYERLTSSIVCQIVMECIASSGIDVKGRKHGPHALRSSLASNLVSEGTSYDTIRKILGHTDPNAVKHYVKTDIERLRKCALDPPEPTGIFLDLLCGRRRV